MLLPSNSEFAQLEVPVQGDDPRRMWDHLALVMQVGLTFVGSVLFCLWLGHLIDGWAGTRGVFKVIFILLGIAGGGYTAWRQIMEAEAQEEEGGSQRPKP